MARLAELMRCAIDHALVPLPNSQSSSASFFPISCAAVLKPTALLAVSGPSNRIAAVIKREFGVRCHPDHNHIGRLPRAIVWIDEAGFYLLPALVRTWAPKGEPPALRAPCSYDHLSAISAITPRGQVLLHVQQLLRGYVCRSYRERLSLMSDTSLSIISTVP